MAKVPEFYLEKILQVVVGSVCRHRPNFSMGSGGINCKLRKLNIML